KQPTARQKATAQSPAAGTQRTTTATTQGRASAASEGRACPADASHITTSAGVKGPTPHASLTTEGTSRLASGGKEDIAPRQRSASSREEIAESHGAASCAARRQ